jgi:ubiquinone/menaquinone biosynthesis C-methylase UbiE
MTRPEDLPQNIYDDAVFFAGYTQLDRFQGAWGRALEHNLLTSLLGDVRGKRVVELGCGGGQLAYHLAKAGAASVTAFDASERMIAHAREHWAHERVSYARMTMEEASFPDGSFDAAVSSLALHYVAGYEELLQRIAGWLTPDGAFAFSTEHPIYAARVTDEGWQRDAGGEVEGWTIDAYHEEGLRERHWFVPGVRRYHRTVATLINGLVVAGFTIERMLEPVPDAAWLRDHPQDTNERRRPMFLLIGARKR